MGVYKHYIVESITEIRTTPDKIWGFFYDLEDNYTRWHPECHNYWRWIKGTPLELGSKMDSEETIGGHKSRVRATVVTSVENRKVALKPVFPISFMCPKLEWVFEPKGDYTLFVARTHYKFGRIFLALQKKTVDEIISLTQKHMDEEGDNLKRILDR
jgi:uncharacterized C2H2 Zn-finger protein